MKLIKVIHSHRHGTDTYIFKSKTYSEKKHEEFVDLAIKAFDIDFEENRIDEDIELQVVATSTKEIKSIEVPNKKK